MIDKVNAIIWNFMGKGKKEKLNKDDLFGEYKEGGPKIGPIRLYTYSSRYTDQYFTFSLIRPDPTN